MSKHKDGGAAFPGRVVPALGVSLDTPGMSLRDYFAGQALANGRLAVRSYFSAEDFAELCYEQADAMLKHRADGVGAIS